MDFNAVNGKILIVDDVHPRLMKELTSMGFTVDYQPDISKEGARTAVNDCSGLVVRSKLMIDEQFLQHAPKLRFIARAGAGIDQLAMAAIEARNIAVVNAPEGNRDALGEHMVGMLLMLHHHLHHANQQVRRQVWDREGNRGMEIKGKTIGLLGYGYMGSAFAEKLQGFGVQVIAYDKHKNGYTSPFVREASIEEIFAKADIFSIHVPLSEANKHLVNHDFLGKFSKPIVLLNSARGEVLDTKALIDGLTSGKVLGACLDVLENEKFAQYTADDKWQFEQLASFPQVVFSPHIAGWTYQSYERISEVLADKIRKLYAK